MKELNFLRPYQKTNKVKLCAQGFNGFYSEIKFNGKSIVEEYK